MIICKTSESLRKMMSKVAQNNTVGFVPTMGALHQGHISLIEKSKSETDFTVASIFVNPTQFNNKTDFEKYPISTEQDIDMLERAGCDLLFLPSVEEMYPANEPVKYFALDHLETILEGAFRPGHYQGVAMIVDKLLSLVKPNKLFLGLKDYQQVMVIQKMIDLCGHSTKIIGCPTLREPDGLAMSSRNRRLSAEARERAALISKALQYAKDNYGKVPLFDLESTASKLLQENGFAIDYFSVSDAETLEPLHENDSATKAVALVAAYLGDIRLIDNMPLN